MKNHLALFIMTIILLLGSCTSRFTSPSTPDAVAVKYYQYIIDNNPKCVELQVIRYLGGTDKERELMNAQIDEKMLMHKDNLSRLFFPYNAKLTSVEVVPNEEGKPYTITQSRLLRDAEAVVVKLKLTFEDGKEIDQKHVVVKYNGTWLIQ